MFGLLHFCMWNHTTCDPGKGDPFQATAFCSAETSGRLVFSWPATGREANRPVLMSSSVERFEIGAWNGTCIAQRRRMGDTSQVLLKASRSVKSQMFPNSGLFVVNWEWEKCSQVCKLLAVVSHFYRFYHFSCFVLPWRVQHFRKKLRGCHIGHLHSAWCICRDTKRHVVKWVLFFWPRSPPVQVFFVGRLI